MDEQQNIIIYRTADGKLMLTTGLQAQTAEFETATEAVKNMGIGWNLVNTLDAHAEGEDWFNPEGWWSWETCWSNPVTKPELMKMIRKAGFKTMRIPVTWYPHTDSQGNIDAAWMKRVHEVVVLWDKAQRGEKIEKIRR